MTSTINVVISFPSYERGGAEQSLLNYVTALADRFFVTVVTTDNFPLIENDHLRIVRVKNRKKRFSNLFFHLIALFKFSVNRRDSIFITFQGHVATIPILFFTRIISSNKSKIFMRESNDVGFYANENLKSPLARYIFIRIIKAVPAALCDRIIVNSAGSKKSFSETVGFEKKLILLYNPAFTSANRPLNERVLTGNVSKGDGYMIGFIGRMEDQKQPLDFVRIANKVLALYPEARALMIGSGSMQTEVEQELAKSSFRDRIVCMPFQQDVDYYLRQISIFVCTSKYEGLPNVLLEAIYCGCKVVSYDCPSGPREILHDGKFGSLVKTGDVDSAVEAICRMGQEDTDLSGEALHAHLRLFTDQNFLVDFEKLGIS